MSCRVERASAIRGKWPTALAVAMACFAAITPATALEEPASEKTALKACEKRLCAMIIDKGAADADFSCDAQKTWAKSTLEGGESKGVSWGFGDARCTTSITLERADIAAALSKPKHTVRIPAQKVNCILEREGEIKPVTVKLAPKLTFKNGKADKVWINLESIDGPADVKSTIWTAAKLEDTIGIFHGPMIKSINKFMFKQCPKRYGPNATAKADDDDDKPDAKTAAKAADKAAAKKPVAPAAASPKAKASTTTP